jgi:hypothetical protein
MPGRIAVGRTARPSLFVLAASILLGLACLVVLSIHSTGDYNVNAPVGGDNAGPGIQALLHGSLAGYANRQPVVGLTSIILRIPLVALASSLGANALQGYQVGAIVCLLPLILGAAWLVAAPELSGRERLFRFLAVVLVIQSPIIHDGLGAGHPEGVLATVLGTAAVLLAMQGRARSAALLLGLAISSKETGLIAVLPVLVALPGRRREVVAIAAGVVAVLCCSVWLSAPDAFARSLHGEGATRFLSPFSLIWPLSAPVRIGSQLSVARLMPAGLTRTPASALTLLAVGAVVTVWFIQTQRRGARCRPLVLLVLLGLLRCMCDSTHEEYYWITLLIPLAAWEALEGGAPSRTALLSLTVLLQYLLLGRIPPAYLYIFSTSAEMLLALHLARRAMVFDAQATTGASRSRAAGWARSALAGMPNGREHERSVLSSSALANGPMHATCDAQSTGS